MADATYGPKIQRSSGGDLETVISGGAIVFEEGGKLQLPLTVKTANFTLTAAQSGGTYLCDAADIVVTLPATVAGVQYTFIIGPNGLATVTGLSLSPVAADAIHGNGLTSVDNKDLINTAATDREGDFVTIVGDGVDGWFIVAINGTWAKEA